MGTGASGVQSTCIMAACCSGRSSSYGAGTICLGGAVQGVHPFVIYLAGINALTFILFAIDYAIARYNQDEDTGLMDAGS